MEQRIAPVCKEFLQATGGRRGYRIDALSGNSQIEIARGPIAEELVQLLPVHAFRGAGGIKARGERPVSQVQQLRLRAAALAGKFHQLFFRLRASRPVVHHKGERQDNNGHQAGAGNDCPAGPARVALLQRHGQQHGEGWQCGLDIGPENIAREGEKNQRPKAPGQQQAAPALRPREMPSPLSNGRDKQRRGGQAPGEGGLHRVPPDGAQSRLVGAAVEVAVPAGIHEAEKMFADDEILQEAGGLQLRGDIPGQADRQCEQGAADPGYTANASGRLQVQPGAQRHQRQYRRQRPLGQQADAQPCEQQIPPERRRAAGQTDAQRRDQSESGAESQEGVGEHRARGHETQRAGAVDGDREPRGLPAGQRAGRTEDQPQDAQGREQGWQARRELAHTQ